MRKKKAFVLFCMVFLIGIIPCSRVYATENELEETHLSLQSNTTFNVYYKHETKVYDGNGKDWWIHIKPDITPNKITVRMYDYKNNKKWDETYTINGTKHMFVGSNIKKVTLSGNPGGVVYVTNSEH